MGQTSSSSGKKAHLETAQKTGALVLKDRKLTEIPDLSSVQKVLRTLDLSNNKISSLPSAISTLHNLKNFAANNNRIALLPEEFGFLSKLDSITLSNNKLTGLPSTFSELKHLKSINFSFNDMEEFPAALCNLPHLDNLDMSHNKISSIPDEIETLQAVELNMNNNQLSEISPMITSCTRLKTLRMERNQLTLSALPLGLLKNSQVSLLCVEDNLIDMKELEDSDGYEEYMERYTAVKKKLY